MCNGDALAGLSLTASVRGNLSVLLVLPPVFFPCCEGCDEGWLCHPGGGFLQETFATRILVVACLPRGPAADHTLVHHSPCNLPPQELNTFLLFLLCTLLVGLLESLHVIECAIELRLLGHLRCGQLLFAFRLHAA